ncbi:Unknown protein [Arabidopsis thaliana]|uniref:F22K20.6 protein n=2 Tax=Arabidopsis TaxID=3701 RepID=O49282_ARATH|nr:uncharacterized protein AT1G76960 [Arabidopsis thaliana]KAG7659837.1 hypothetical protein ISN44_As01g066630 [Arabidopsis suecica]AAC00627.1 Unknown protein [Arabidopsis thaliana]AAK49573.1 Unknown protein [Arabidopsis thaliana]AAK93593.1 unknown protein [Arabidopsis thaliana]AAM14117.1 unknown protein [Arabidopsis thaliana]|eukprot:NP_565145.1 transmembrane protein [Arabidopsis thaliana]
MKSSSELLVIMIFLFLALLIISHAQSLPGTPYGGPGPYPRSYPVCYPPYCRP